MLQVAFVHSEPACQCQSEQILFTCMVQTLQTQSPNSEFGGVYRYSVASCQWDCPIRECGAISLFADDQDVRKVCHV